MDNKNWVIDFGGLKELKGWLEDQFDHKLCLDNNDPYIAEFQKLEELGLVELRYFYGVGAEKFAEHALYFANQLAIRISGGRCWCEEVECSEHGANSAIVRSENV